MKNEKRLIDADALKMAFAKKEGAEALGHSTVKLARVYAIVEAQPTVDAVEVVRCKDCKHYALSDFRKPNEHRWCEISGNGCDVEYPEPNDFCSYGERREGE